MSADLRNPAPLWVPAHRSEYVVLWHGCTQAARENIEAHGIDLAHCAVATDFGRGFYTTTLERQARDWAWKQATNTQKRNRGAAGTSPVLLRFRVRRYTRAPRTGPLDDGLDALAALQFVRGDYDADDYWSLVQHCRQSRPADPASGAPEVAHDHRRPPTGWYQLVCGPVAAFWEQRITMSGADQFSFHEGGTYLLDALVARGKGSGPDGRGDPGSYQWFDVTEEAR